MSIIFDYDGVPVRIKDLSVVWWRRVNQPQKDPERFGSAVEFELICNEWKGALFGAVSDCFTGVWVNDPKYDSLAGNKIYHLNIAREVGLTIPDTLVTNKLNEALLFCENHNDNVIVKKIQGGSNLSLATVAMSSEMLRRNAELLLVCPVMFQEKVEAKSHIRANCFGKKVFPVEIMSKDLDWRRNLNCDFKEYALLKGIVEKMVLLLKRLRLEMGIMDLIVSDQGIVWLEINPQGQFLFTEGLSGVNIKRPFAEFLKSIANVRPNKSRRETLQVRATTRLGAPS